MRPDSAIELNNVSKSFKIQIRNSDSDKLFSPKAHSVNKVLDDVSLTVKKGTVMGVLGRNGSGKSTILKIISRIIEPDSGTVEIGGKLASILELGMGFHPDMSGRENIYIKGEMYGFSRKQIEERVDQIIEYSGIDRYIDNPVKTYSSGMVGRLAFAIMVNVDADVLLVDEILSVGDAAFSAKAAEHFKKMTKSGKTVLFVSHNINFLEQICSRAIWIENGKIVEDGPAKKVCSIYRNRVSESFDIISDLAHSGVADAQYKLAMMYHNGTDVLPDEDLSALWMKRAAEQGNTLAQVRYADMLMQTGSLSDAEDAHNFYKSAANAGNEEARMKISSLSRHEGLNQDLEAVKDIFRQLAEREDPLDMYRYADLLLKTAWSDEDRVKAFEWFVKASDAGNADAMHSAAIMLRDGKGVAKDVEKCVYYLEMAAKLGLQRSQVLLGDLYYEGKILEKDNTKAIHWYEMAALTGNPRAQYMTAIMYRDGLGTDQNVTKAEEWFTTYVHSSATQHMIWAGDALRYVDLDAKYSPTDLYKMASKYHNLYGDLILGNTYHDGIYEVRNDATSQMYYERSGSLWGTWRTSLARVLMITEGLNNIARIIELYEQSGACGDGEALYRLSLIYNNGLGVPRDELKAKSLALKAARYGNISACRAIVKNLKNIDMPDILKTSNKDE